jgi:hypothetical protein
MRRAGIIALAGSITLALLGTRAALSQVAKPKDLDKQHDDLLRDFSARSHKLALQYQQSGNHDKAKETLNLLLKVAPNDDQAKNLLEKISKQELSENKKTLKVLANQSWQKTGVVVFEGKPVSIEAKGEWVFKMNRSVSGDGMEVPEDMKQFPLGALIGYVEAVEPAVRGTAKDAAAKKDKPKEKKDRPFLVGAQKVFTPQSTGMLYLKMHDSDPADNAGQLAVTISGQVREK